MTIDTEALANAANKCADNLCKMLESGQHLGIHATLSAAFLQGWRYAMKTPERNMTQRWFTEKMFRRENGSIVEIRKGDPVSSDHKKAFVECRSVEDYNQALRAIQNCLLVVPDGKFKDDMNKWLDRQLGL